MGTKHKDLTGGDLHPPGYVQEADPGAVGAGKDWYQPSTGILRRRNQADDGWDWVARPGTLNEETGAEYTLTLTDIGASLWLDHGSAVELIVPSAATTEFHVGAFVRGVQAGSGPIEVIPETSLPVIHSRGSRFTTSGQYAVFNLFVVAEDEWLLWGDLTT